MLNRKYDFIILSRCYKPGSAPSNRLLSLLRGFDELGAKVIVVFAYHNKGFDIVQESYQNIEIVYLWKGDKTSGRITKYLKSLYRVWNLAKNLPKNAKIFLVDEQTYLPILTFGNRLNVFHERTENPEVINKLPFGLQKLYYHSCRKTACIFGISSALCDFFSLKGVKRTAVVNMTVDVNRFANLEKESCESYIAYCGTVLNDKDGVDILLKSFAIVKKNHPNIKLYIIGNCPKDNELNSNLQLIDSLGIKESVILTGLVPYQRIPQLLKNASVLALARPDSIQARCGFPTKLGEYLLTANPIVVTSVGDIPKFLTHGETALLCTPNSVSDFASKLSWALDNYKEAQSIGLKGREVALREFNYLNEAKKIYNIISSSK